MQDQDFDCQRITSVPMDKKLYPNSECLADLEARVTEYVKEVNAKYKTQTVITVSHAEPITMFKKILKGFDYLTKRNDYYAHNRTAEEYKSEVHYRDNDRNKEVDLHKPYVDSYRFKK